MMPAYVKQGVEKAIDLYYDQLNNSSIHPIEVIAQFHYTFLNEIHPFDDGNGRVARLLMAIQQLQNGLPVVFPKEHNKVQYINILIQCEERGSTEDLVTFFANLTIEAAQQKIINKQKFPFIKSSKNKKSTQQNL